MNTPKSELLSHTSTQTWYSLPLSFLHCSKCINFHPVSQIRNLEVSPGSLLSSSPLLPSNPLANAVQSKSSTFHCLHCSCPNSVCHNLTSQMLLWPCNWLYTSTLFFSFFKLNQIMTSAVVGVGVAHGIKSSSWFPRLHHLATASFSNFCQTPSTHSSSLIGFYFQFLGHSKYFRTSGTWHMFTLLTVYFFPLLNGCAFFLTF